MATLRQYPFFQEAYVVKDLQAGVEHWNRLFNAGPFILVPHHKTDRFDYRGTQQEADVSYAFGYLGDMMIQLIEQHDDTPSIYRDMYAAGQEGFHHVGVLVHEFEAEFRRLESLGFECVTRLFADGVDAATSTLVRPSAASQKSTVIHLASFRPSQAGTGPTSFTNQETQPPSRGQGPASVAREIAPRSRGSAVQLGPRAYRGISSAVGAAPGVPVQGVIQGIAVRGPELCAFRVAHRDQRDLDELFVGNPQNLGGLLLEHHVQRGP